MRTSRQAQKRCRRSLLPTRVSALLETSASLSSPERSAPTTSDLRDAPFAFQCCFSSAFASAPPCKTLYPSAPACSFHHSTSHQTFCCPCSTLLPYVGDKIR